MRRCIAAFERIEAARGADHADLLRIQHAGGAAALRATRGVDAAVLEVGLGGRLDATNLVDADVAVLVLGRLRSSRLAGRHARADRRGEGRHLPRRGRPAVLGTRRHAGERVRRDRARSARAPIVAERDFSWQASTAPTRWDYRGARRARSPACRRSALAGAIQYRNAATALAALEALGLRRRPRAAAERRRARCATVAAALRACGWRAASRSCPGAVEWILDIAHNEPAARVLAAQLARAAAAGGARAHLRGDRHAQRTRTRRRSPRRSRRLDRWIVCALPGARGGSAAQLAARLALRRGSFELPTRCRRAASWRARGARRGSRGGVRLACTPWGRRSSGFGYTNGSVRRGLRPALAARRPLC